MTEHTPGPWVMNYRGTIGHIKSIADIRSGLSPTVTKFGEGFSANSISHEESLANARLIAAAPELLAAMKQCLQLIEHMESQHCRNFDAGNVARDAIQKATGVRPEEFV